MPGDRLWNPPTHTSEDTPRAQLGRQRCSDGNRLETPDAPQRRVVSKRGSHTGNTRGEDETTLRGAPGTTSCRRARASHAYLTACKSQSKHRTLDRHQDAGQEGGGDAALRAEKGAHLPGSLESWEPCQRHTPTGNTVRNGGAGVRAAERGHRRPGRPRPGEGPAGARGLTARCAVESQRKSQVSHRVRRFPFCLPRLLPPSGPHVSLFGVRRCRCPCSGWRGGRGRTAGRTGAVPILAARPRRPCCQTK